MTHQGTLWTFEGQRYTIYSLDSLDGAHREAIAHMPYTRRILVENALRRVATGQAPQRHLDALLTAHTEPGQETSFMPGRILLQDLTGVPALVDLASMRDAATRLGLDPETINPALPVDLVVDHSIHVDAYGSAQAMTLNQRLEFARNKERYTFLKWGAQAFSHFRLIPPGVGIVHQVNLEHLASGVLRTGDPHTPTLSPDTMVGTDSHTPMINGLGLVGWGVGGIEAEAAMMGQALSMRVPEVVGVTLTGAMRPGTTATDLVLTLTQILRQHGVVGKVVEFIGEGLDNLTLADRATIANMAPEYGATMGYFPMDHQSMRYLRDTGRDPAQVRLVQAYAKRQGLWRTPTRAIHYADTLQLDLSTIEPSLAGPKRPQDRLGLSEVREAWRRLGTTQDTAPLEIKGESTTLRDGAVVLAAITSCTNTSNPDTMLAAGLLAQKAHALGLRTQPWVKTSLAPGSRVVTDYLREAKLDVALEALGFHTVGYGCTTCIGNSGPLEPAVEEAITTHKLATASVLSGNRNFEGRVSPHTRGNFLASPPLVVAYAIAGTVDIDLHHEPLGTSATGQPVTLRDIWPSAEEIAQLRARVLRPEQFQARYAKSQQGPEPWEALHPPAGPLYKWNPDSTYLREAPFFDAQPGTRSIHGARALLKLGDSVTTDHISPAGAISLDSEASAYLQAQGVRPGAFNSYGARRGNHEVMMRGTFANIRLRNQLAPGTEGPHTTYFGPQHPEGPITGAQCSVFAASMAYQKHQIPLVVLAGEDYGMGSSRDWAAKGSALLGVRAVLAVSFERIHRNNLIGMGILPLQFLPGDTGQTLQLTGKEHFDIDLPDHFAPGQRVRVTATPETGDPITFEMVCRVDNSTELQDLQHGGLLPAVLDGLAQGLHF